jgi:hypothetical protein
VFDTGWEGAGIRMIRKPENLPECTSRWVFGGRL